MSRRIQYNTQKVFNLKIKAIKNFNLEFSKDNKNRTQIFLKHHRIQSRRFKLRKPNNKYKKIQQKSNNRLKQNKYNLLTKLNNKIKYNKIKKLYLKQILSQMAIL